MSVVRWLPVGLLVGLMLGCTPEAPPEGGGGGGPAVAAQSEEQALRTRDHTGNAYLAAARAHRSLALGDYRVARNDLADVRRQLALADAAASPIQREEIAQVLGKVSEVESEVLHHDPRAVGGSRQLVNGLLLLFDSYAGFGPRGGGAGLAPAPERPEGPTD